MLGEFRRQRGLQYDGGMTVVVPGLDPDIHNLHENAC